MSISEAEPLHVIAARQKLLPKSMRASIGKIINRQPLWIKVMLSLSVALMVVALAAGELMRLQLQADYSTSLRNTSEDTFLLLSAATLEPVISEDIPQLRSIVNEIA